MGDIWKSGIKYTGGGGASSLPSGGTTGQVLAKKSDKSRDVEWKDENPVDAQEIKDALGYTPADEDDVAKKYEKPSGGIPKSDLAADVVSEINDHSDPEAVKFVDQTLTEAQKGTARSNIGAYAKPSTGIPKADLAQAVKDSLDKADSALQSYTETDPTVPDWAKDASKPTYNYSEIQDAPELSSNVQADKASNTKASTPKSVYQEVHPTVGSSQPATGFVTNTFYRLGTITTTLNIVFATPSDSTIENEYMFSFSTSTTPPAVVWPLAIAKWQGNCLNASNQPVLMANKTYQVSVLDGLGIIIEF